MGSERNMVVDDGRGERRVVVDGDHAILSNWDELVPI